MILNINLILFNYYYFINILQTIGAGVAKAFVKNLFTKINYFDLEN